MDGRPWALVAILVASILLGASAAKAPQEDRAYPLWTMGWTTDLTIEAWVQVPARELDIFVPALTFQGAYSGPQGEPDVRAQLVVRELEPQGTATLGDEGIVLFVGDGMRAHQLDWLPHGSTALPEGYGNHRTLQFVWTLDEDSGDRWSLESMVQAYDQAGQDGLSSGVSAIPPEARTTHLTILGACTAALVAAVALRVRRRANDDAPVDGAGGAGVALAAAGQRWLASIYRSQWTIFSAALAAYGLFAARIYDLIWETTGPAWVGTQTTPYPDWEAHAWTLLWLAGLVLLGVLALDLWRTRRALKTWERLESASPIEGDLV